MQRILLKIMCKMSLLFFAINIHAADQSTLQVSQVRDVVKNIEIATQIGQGGQDQVNSLQDLEKVFGSRMSVLSVDMNSLPTQELQSIAFGGYTFISNSYNRSASVSLNILKELLPLDFQEMAKDGTNSICLGLFGVDAAGNLLTNLSKSVSTMSTTGVLDHFKLYIFKSDGTLLGTSPQYIPLNKYYSQAQQKFITPVFGHNVVSQTINVSNAKQNLGFLLNGKDITSNAQISYPYLICIENIAGIDTPNRYLNFTELSSLLPNITTSSPITSFYQNLDSLEIIIGNAGFSFNQNSLNQSTDIAANGICADISQYIAPLENKGMQLIFAAVDASGNIIRSFTHASVVVDHYLLYILDQNSNLIKAVYVNPAYATDAYYFKIAQSANQITVRINGQTITQGQQYLYPVLINLTYGSGIKIPDVSSIANSNKITLNKSKTLSHLVYNLNSGAATLDVSKKSLFGANWLDSINGLLEAGQTILLNAQQALYSSGSSQASSGYEVTFSAYAVDSTTSTVSQVAEQSFALPSQLSGLTIGYQKNLSKTSQTISIPNSGNDPQNNLEDNWIAIIPSTTAIPAGQKLTYKSLQTISTYGTLKAILNINKNTLYSVPVTSYVNTQNTIPGWYNSGTKQYSGQGFELQLDQMQSGKGYFFVEDNLGNHNIFNGSSGVAALDPKSALLSALEATIVPGGSCTMILLGFDAQGNYIPDIIKTTPYKFGLFIFDAKGNSLSNSPVLFSADDYVGLGKYQLSTNAVGPAKFIVNGLGIHQIKSLTYPFALKVTWKIKGKPAPKPKPKPTPTSIPTSAQIPSSMVIPIYTGQTLTQFGCLLSSQTSESFDATFISTVTEKLKTAGDSVKIKISTLNNVITATAYIKNNQIAQSQSLVLPENKSIESLLYTISGSQEMNFAITKIEGYQDIWLEFKVMDALSYSLLMSLSLSQLPTYISDLNTESIHSLVTDPTSLPGWLLGNCKSGFTLTLNQMNAGNGYAFVQDFWNSCSTELFSGTSGIAALGSSTPAYDSMLTQMKTFSNVSLALFAFDAQNNYISNILSTKPTTFALFAYDKNGNIVSNFPVRFSANDYVGSGRYVIKSGAIAPATFTIAGLRILETSPTLTYPFVLNINWTKATPKPKPMPKPKTDSITSVVYPYQVHNVTIDEVWIAVNINGVVYLLMDNAHSGIHEKGMHVQGNLVDALSTLSTENRIDLTGGIAFSLVQTPNDEIYVYVQSGDGKTFFAKSWIEGLTSLPSQVKWSGAFVQPPTISSDETFIFTTGSHWPSSITIPPFSY